MNKPNLVKLIMSNTDEYKKTHLMRKGIAEVLAIATPFLPSDATAASTTQAASTPAVTPDRESTAAQATESAVNDKERLMLSTIPKLSDYAGTDSVMDGKGFLALVEELHGVPKSTSRALMVSLMKKQFYQIIGKKSGQKKTTIKLLPKGIQYLTDNNLLSAV